MARVSVVIPCYNARPFLRQCIESVLGQTYRDFEIVVVDDGSDDGSVEELAIFASAIKVFSQPRKGVSAARNQGIRLSTGEFIAFLDADDFWSEQYLEQQVHRLGSDPGLGWSHTLSFEVTPAGKPVREIGWGRLEARSDDDFASSLMFTNPLATSSVVVRVGSLRAVGGFDEDLKCGEDWDLWIRLAYRTPAAGIPEPLCFHRRRFGLNLPTMLGRGADWALPQIVRKNLAFLSGPQSAELGAQALLRALLFGVWLHSANADLDQARRLVKEIDEELGKGWRKAKRWPVWIAEFTDQLRDFGPELEEALRSIDACFQVLGNGLYGGSFHSIAIGRYYGIRLFRGSETGNRKEVMRNGLQALRFCPAWLKNRGFRAILGRTILGLEPRPNRKLAEKLAGG